MSPQLELNDNAKSTIAAMLKNRTSNSVNKPKSRGSENINQTKTASKVEVNKSYNQSIKHRLRLEEAMSLKRALNPAYSAKYSMETSKPIEERLTEPSSFQATGYRDISLR